MAQGWYSATNVLEIENSVFMINKLTTPIQFTCARFILKVLWTNRRNAELNKSTSLQREGIMGTVIRLFPNLLTKSMSLFY